MRAGHQIVSGLFLVLATSLLVGSAVGERHIRRITAADLPTSSNSSSPARSSNSNNNVVKTLDQSPVPNCPPGGTNGSCIETLAQEAKRKTKDKLSELSSDDPHSVIEPSVDEAVQERLNSGVLLHLSSAPPDHSHQGGDSEGREPTTSSKEARTRHHDFSEQARGFDSPLTTPRVSLFDDRFLRVSESIRQNLEDLEEQHAFHSTSTPSSAKQETTAASNSGFIPPTSGDISPADGANVALEYTNHVSIQYNDTVDPPRSVFKDIVVENGTHMEYSSSFIHTEHFDDLPTTTLPSVTEPVPEHDEDHHSVTDTPSKSNKTTEDNSVEEANLSEDVVKQQKISSNSSEYLKDADKNKYELLEADHLKDVHNNTVPPGEIHSTTSIRPPLRSQQTTEGSVTTVSSEEDTTVDSKLSRRRYTTRRLQISGIPTTTQAASTEAAAPSVPRLRVRSTTSRPNNSTTSNTDSSTLPPPITTNRTRARMISSARYQANATNSVEELPTLTPVASNGQTPRRKQTTRYSWRRPLNKSENSSEEAETELPMVRIPISTVQPASSESSSKKSVFDEKTTSGEDVNVTTQATRYLRRRPNVTVLVEVDKEVPKDLLSEEITANKTASFKRTLQKPGEISSNEVLVKNSTKPIRNRGSVKFAGLNNLTAGDKLDSLLIPPTAVAWALASMRGPVTSDSGRVVRRPSANDTADEMTTTIQPEDGAETTTELPEGDITTTSISAGAGQLSPVGPTTTGPVDNLLTLGFVTTQRAFEEMESSARSDGPYAEAQSSAAPGPDNIHSRDVRTEESVPTTTEEVMSTTTVNDETTTVSVGSPELTTDSPEVIRTTEIIPQVSTATSPLLNITSSEPEVFSTTEAAPRTSTVISPELKTTSEDPEEYISPESTTLSPLPTTTLRSDLYTTTERATTMEPEEHSTKGSVLQVATASTTMEPEVVPGMGEDLEDTELLDTTPPPTTPALPQGEADLGEEDQHSGNDDQDYIAEVEAPATAEPGPHLPTTTTVSTTTTTRTTTSGEDTMTTTNTPAPETSATTVPPTTEEPDLTTVTWSPVFGDISSYLRVTVLSTWQQVCEQRMNFKEALASLITDKMDKKLTARNVVLANVGDTQCENVVSADKEERQLIDMNVFVLNEDGVFSKELNDIFYILVAPKNFPTPLEIKRVELLQGALPTTSESNNAGVIAAITISCIGAVCLLLLAVLLIVMRKRQKKFNYGQRCTPVSLDAYSLDSVSVYDSVRRKGGIRASKRSYGNPGFDDPGAPSHPVNFAGLANFSSDRAALEEEFAMVPQVAPKSDELPEGAETKNRYSNVIPLPETRVPLTPIEGEPLSDYINANYVRGHKNEQKFYIACQAPLQSTVTDFWRMVWEQQSKVIIMLTDLVENGVEKCADYLPPSEVLDCHRLFGDFQITLKKREEREKYVISTLQLKNLETNLWREVTHLWYLSWPHQGVPEESSSIIAFLIEARPFMKANTGPNIVHCSPGTGRTGTVLACDICIREFELTRMVDIPRCVYRLRRHRAGAVKTRDQYVFIYQVLNTYATKLTGGGGLDSI